MATHLPAMPPRTSPSKMDLAAPVSEIVEIRRIVLTEFLAKRKQIAGDRSLLAVTSVNLQTEVDKGQHSVRVLPHFKLIAKYEDVDDQELLRIEATYLLDYRLPSFAKLKKENFVAFGELNGLYNAWPYWREFVQSTTVRMGLPALTIPVYRPLAGLAAVADARPRSKPRGKSSKKARTVLASQ